MKPIDEITQSERRRIFENDRLTALERRLSTYHAHGQASIDDERQGRFGALDKTTVTGAGPTLQYPRQPPNSPWANDPLPPEPPLGIDINAMEAVGETWEQEASKSTGDAAAPDPSVRRKGWRRI
jgi:hypothetical protein